MPSPPNDLRLSSVGLDLDPAQQDLLSLPSPYHTVDTYNASHETLRMPNTPKGSFSSMFKRFRYSRISSDTESVCGLPSDSHSTNSSLYFEREPKHVHWADHQEAPSQETPTDRWFSVVFLLLLLPLLFNFFFVFNGPPNGIPHYPKAAGNPLPHKGFRFQEHGRNFTCYETRTTTLKANYEFSNTFSAYDYLWHELQGKSGGAVYTKIGREDGQVRRAGVAMFHQLSCLAALRKVVQGLQEGKMHVDVDVSEHHGYWSHCLDYLRQTILCNADDDVEVSEVRDGRWATSGFGSQKECRDSSWLYEITSCGEGGCPGKPFYHDQEELEAIHMEEEEEIEKWARKHETET